MWLDCGGGHKAYMNLLYEGQLRKKNKRPTSDGRYGAILLYLLRNKQRNDDEAIEMIINRIPYDLVLCDDYTIRRK